MCGFVEHTNRKNTKASLLFSTQLYHGNDSNRTVVVVVVVSIESRERLIIM